MINKAHVGMKEEGFSDGMKYWVYWSEKIVKFELNF